jgi:hypothetical protein
VAAGGAVTKRGGGAVLQLTAHLEAVLNGLVPVVDEGVRFNAAHGSLQAGSARERGSIKGQSAAPRRRRWRQGLAPERP